MLIISLSFLLTFVRLKSPYHVMISSPSPPPPPIFKSHLSFLLLLQSPKCEMVNVKSVCLSTNRCTASPAGLTLGSSDLQEAVASRGLLLLGFLATVLQSVLWERAAWFVFFFVFLLLASEKVERELTSTE